MKKAKQTFQVTGLHPFKPHKFSDYNFMPSEVGNRRQGNWNESPTDETGKEL
jgi:hypothetical protein